jgi:hypothetical protein
MSRIYVGNLPIDVRKRDVEDIFSKCVGSLLPLVFGRSSSLFSGYGPPSIFALALQPRLFFCTKFLTTLLVLANEVWAHR